MQDLIPLLLSLIAMTVGGVWVIGETALGAALVRRTEGRDPGQDLDAVHEELDDLREQIARIRDEHKELIVSAI